MSTERKLNSTRCPTLPKTLDGQLRALMREHVAAELPRNRRRGSRDGDGQPLSAWMRGTRESCRSRIVEVVEGRARYPYFKVSDGSAHLAERIAKRYDLTWVQLALLEGHITSRYRGRPNKDYARAAGLVRDGWGSGRCTTLPGYYTYEKVLAAARAVRRKDEDALTCVPLRAILDERLTNLVLLDQLGLALKTTAQFFRHWR